jgi:hypothetical protein
MKAAFVGIFWGSSLHLCCKASIVFSDEAFEINLLSDDVDNAFLM